MGEAQTVSLVRGPNTVDSLASELSALGLKAGMTVLVHSSLSALGWVNGGPIAVIRALLNVVTDSGTIIMPAHSSGYTEPSNWQHPPVPEHWWPIIRDTMPAYNRHFTPSAYVGVIAEAFRSFPDVVRSHHPSVSFSAFGKNAALITEGHKLEISLGDTSPLGRIYDLDGFVLLLGANHDTNTSFHLAESRLPSMPSKDEGAPLLVNGEREWVAYKDLAYTSDDFAKIGSDFEKSNSIASGRVGVGISKLFSQRAAVDFALEWLKVNRR